MCFSEIDPETVRKEDLPSWIRRGGKNAHISLFSFLADYLIESTYVTPATNEEQVCWQK
jgi:hypothetical protein